MPLDFSDLPVTQEPDAPTPETLNRAVIEAGHKHDVDPALIHSVIHQESGGDPYAVSDQSAAGLMQLTPATARSLGVRDVFNWRQSLDAGTRYLRQGLDHYDGDPQLAAAYYHGGPNTEQWGPKTAQYASDVMDKFRQRARSRSAEAPLSFDDLVPKRDALSFDDLIPAKPTAGLPVRKGLPSQIDLSDDDAPDKNLTRQQALNQATSEGATMALTEAEAPLPPVQRAGEAPTTYGNRQPGTVQLRSQDPMLRPFAPGEWLDNPDGSWSSERTMTVTDPKLNGGKPSVIPSLWLQYGKPVLARDEDEAVQMAAHSGLRFPSFDNLDDAEKFAIAREEQWQTLPKEKSDAVPPLWTRPALEDVVSSPQAASADIQQSQEPSQALQAIGAKTARAFGTEPLGMNEEMAGYLRQAGVFPKEGEGLQPLKQVNEAALRSLAAVFDAAILRGLPAGFAGLQETMYQASKALGLPERAARDIAASPEAFMGMLGNRAHERQAFDARNARRSADMAAPGTPQAIARDIADAKQETAQLRADVQAAKAEAAAPPEPAFRTPEQAALAELEAPEPAATPEQAALTQGVAQAQGDGLVPIRDGEGNLIGYERPEVAPDRPPASSAEVSPPPAPTPPAATVEPAEAAPPAEIAPPRIRTIEQIQTEDGVSARKAAQVQQDEILAVGRPITAEEAAARKAGVQPEVTPGPDVAESPLSAAQARPLPQFKALEQQHFPAAGTESFQDQFGAVPVKQVAVAGHWLLERASPGEEAVMWALTGAATDRGIPVVLSPHAYEIRMSESAGRPLFTSTSGFFDMPTQRYHRAALEAPAWVAPDGRGFVSRERGVIGHLDAPLREVAERPEQTTPEAVSEKPPLFSEPPAPVEQVENAPAPTRGRAVTPFETAPREPTRLIEFLRRPTVQFPGTIHETTVPGGLVDAGGDLKAILGGSKGRPGLINKAGRSLDDAAQSAWDAGYLPGAERPTINDLLDAIRDDHEGRPRYSAHDLDRADAYNSAIQRNTELDRLSTEHDIPTNISRAEFTARLADKLSVDEMARQMEEQAAAHEGAYRALDKAARDWVDAHPDAAPEGWNARDFYGQSQARTLKDLEDEYRQSEKPSAAAEQRRAGHEEPGPAGQPAGAGEEGGGPRRSGADPAGRGETEMAAPQTDLLGRPVAEPRAVRTAEPTLRNDPDQHAMPGMEPSAVQAQAARDAQGRGALQSDAAQKRPDEGLFAPDTSGQGGLYSFPGMLFDPALYRRAFGSLRREVARPEFEVLRDKKGLARVAAEVRAGFAPTAMRGAKPMEYALREHNARSAQAYDQSFHALEKVRAAADRLSKQAQVEFTDRMERGEKQPTPELETVAKALRGQLDAWQKKVQGLGKGYLANAIDNYMGHIWGNYAEWAGKRSDLLHQGEELSQAEMEQIARAKGQRRQPLRGSGSFLKQRSFPTQLEGIEAGLIPATFNPVDLQLIKLHEMQKFYHGTLLGEHMKDSGLAHWVSSAPEAQHEARLAGWRQLDDTIFKPRAYTAAAPIGERGVGHNQGPDARTMPGWVDPGSYWSPEPIARVFNNFMSQGWHGQSSIYDAFRRGNNALNAAQLGFSGFHASFVTADTAMSKSALGLQQVLAGHPIRGLSNIAQGMAIAPAVIGTVRKGDKVRKAWLAPENATPEMRQIVDALKAGGGRVSMPAFFRTSASGSFFKKAADLKSPQSVFYDAAQMVRDAKSPLEKAVMVPLRLAGRTLDTIQEPLMGWLVPRAKLGVFADLAQNWLRDHPTASHTEVQAAMTKFMDSVDNRLGQLNYDNLFWSKTLKDIAFVSTRSVGWNLGTVRELGGAFVDSGSALKAIANGKAPEFTTRMAYAMVLPVVTAEIGAILTYLATGKGPQEMMDYFYPPSGGDENERRAIPGYMKDVIAAWHNPVETVLNKTAPLISTIQELVRNKDYYGGIIYDPERDKGPVQAYGDYLLNQAAPFSARALNRMRDQGAPWQDQAMAFFGFQPAPKSITDPERGEAFEAKANAKAYRKREREPGRMQFFNAQ